MNSSLNCSQDDLRSRWRSLQATVANLSAGRNQFRRVRLDAPFSGFPSAGISVGSVRRDAPYCFLQHVLPPRLQKIRYYGFLSRRSNIDLDDIRAAVLESLKEIEPDLELEAWTVPSLRPASHSGEDDGPRGWLRQLVASCLSGHATRGQRFELQWPWRQSLLCDSTQTTLRDCLGRLQLPSVSSVGWHVSQQ